MVSIVLKESMAKVVHFETSGRSMLLRPRIPAIVSSAEAKEFKKSFSFLAADIVESASEPVGDNSKLVKESKKEKSEEETHVSSSAYLSEDGEDLPKRAKRKSGKRKRSII